MAYNMLIAEDELEEFELVMYLLKKFNMDSKFDIVHAKNGKQALVYLEEKEIDMLLTDIEMPFANGLQIASKARQRNAELPIVFFSCYDDFSYVKSALTVRACNYLLKPLDPVEFEKTMLQTIEQIQSMEMQKTSQINRMAAVKNHYLYVKLNRMTCDDSQLMQAGLELDFVKNYTRIVILHFEEPFFDCDAKRSEDFKKMLLDSFPTPFDFVNLNSSQSVLLFTGQAKTVMADFEELCRKIHIKIENLYHVRGYFVISPLLNEAYMLADGYEDISSLLETRFFYQERFVFCKESAQPNISDKQEICSQILGEIEGDVDSWNMEKLSFDVQRMNQIFEQNKNFSHIYVRYIYSQLVQIIYRNQGLEKMQKDIEDIFSCSFIHEIEAIITRVLQKIQKEQQFETTGGNQVITQVKQYISQHYQEQLTLNELADLVYLNASYLSTLFKRETGTGINEYMKKIRMEKAKKMLTQTNKKVSRIAEEVGFYNHSYFIKSFHEYYGETPAKIRQR